MELFNTYLVVLLVLIIVIIILMFIFRNPYDYPYCTINIDISRRRNVRISEEIEQYLLDNGTDLFKQHRNLLVEWKGLNSRKSQRSLFRFIRVKQYHKVVDDNHLFIFNLCRRETRYKQRNYNKVPYVVSTVRESTHCGYDHILKKYKELEKIGFETTSIKYHSKNQRKLMTKELREKIKLRDKHTCQNCGKYMPDDIGLHIDHIIPISKSGKSLASNLQVLCSKCNGKKSNKIL